MTKGEEIEIYTDLDRIANRTKLTDSQLASVIMSWGRKRGYRVIDEVAVAYRMGFFDGKKANETRVAKAFAKIYPNQKREADPDVIAAVEAVTDSTGADALNHVDVVTPDGNTEVYEYAESEE